MPHARRHEPPQDGLVHLADFLRGAGERLVENAGAVQLEDGVRPQLGPNSRPWGPCERVVYSCGREAGSGKGRIARPNPMLGGLLKSAVLLGAAVLVSACTFVRSDVTTFHTLSSPPSGESFVVLPLEGQEGSIEFEGYVREIERRLVAEGYSLAATPGTADYAVFFAYAVSDRETIAGTTPIYGRTGGRFSTVTGSFEEPTFGIIGGIPYAKTQYTRVLELDIVDQRKSTSDKVFEGRVVNSGRSGSFSQVAQCMIDALFRDFPGASGRTERVTVDGETCVR